MLTLNPKRIHRMLVLAMWESIRRHDRRREQMVALMRLAERVKAMDKPLAVRAIITQPSILEL